jgi:hypothetical protein
MVAHPRATGVDIMVSIARSTGLRGGERRDTRDPCEPDGTQSSGGYLE